MQCLSRLRNGGGLLRTPRGLNNPKMGLLSFSSFWGILVQGTFLPPNGSISNITGWKLVDPTSGEIPRLFWIQKILKSPKLGLKFQGRVFLKKKKAPARKPANSRPEWGSTPRWSIHQNPIQVLVKKWPFPKVKKKFQRIGQIEAVT